MKYITPTLEITEIESSDVITASSGYEVEDNEDSGNIIFDALNIFS